MPSCIRVEMHNVIPQTMAGFASPVLVMHTSAKL